MTLFTRMLSDTTEATAPATPTDDTLADGVNPKVEYDAFDLGSISPDELRQVLNSKGQQGWQLVTSAPYLIFQRLVKPKELRGPVGFSADAEKERSQ